MTPPIDPVEREGVEKDVEMVQNIAEWLREFEPDAEDAEALDHLLVTVQRLGRENEELRAHANHDWTELTLEKQRGEALRAHDPELSLAAENERFLDTIVRLERKLGAARAALKEIAELKALGQARGVAREALRISQGETWTEEQVDRAKQRADELAAIFERRISQGDSK